MNYVDLGMFAIIIVSALLGWKNGVIKSTVKLIVLIVVGILAYQLKTPLANFLIGVMPFFNFAGIFEGIQGINILFYHAVSFIFVFIMLYSILSILISVAGVFDKLLKMTVILYLPDKILGAIVGLIEGVAVSFVIIFTMSGVPHLQEYVDDSLYASRVLSRTPIIRQVLANSTNATQDISDAITEYEKTDDKDTFHIDVINALIKYGIITADEVEKLIEEEKINLSGASFN